MAAAEAEGTDVARCTMERLMSELGIAGTAARRRKPLVLAGGLALLADRTGQLPARLAFAAAAGLVAACGTTWRRLRRLELRRWRSGQAIYRGRRVTVVSAWGVEGQPPPTIEPPAVTSTTTPAVTSTTKGRCLPTQAKGDRPAGCSFARLPVIPV
jgi:hypothetical protein